MDIEEIRERVWQDAKDELKNDRKEFKIIGGENLELVREELPPEIHGALDFTEDRAYIGVPIQVEVNKDDRTFLAWKTGIITSERELIMLDYDMINKGTEFMRIGYIPKNLKERWQRKSFFDYLEKVEDPYSFEDVFNMIKEQTVYYMELMDDREYDLVTTWIMMTYFYPMFSTLPIIYLNGIRASGKTKLLMLMTVMGFSDGTISPNISVSAFFRSIEESRIACFIDENERIGRKEKGELKELLNACYKKGAVVKRSQETLDYGGVKNYQVREFNVFAPLAIGSIWNIDDVLESRCIRITLQRTLSKKGNREINMDSLVFQNIRNALFTLTLKYWKQLRNVYNGEFGEESEEKNQKLEVNDDSISNQLLYNKEEGGRGGIYIDSPHSPPPLSNRELEMWKPVFSIAKLVNNDVFKRVYSLAVDKSNYFKEENIAEEANSIIIDGLIRTVTKDDWYQLADLNKDIQTYHEETDWLKPKLLSNILKTLKLGTSKRKVHGGRVAVFLTVKDVQETGRKVGLDVDEILKEQGFEGVTDQVGKLEVIIGTEEKLKSAVISEATAAGITNAETKIQNMLNSGLLMEPQIGYIKKVGG